MSETYRSPFGIINCGKFMTSNDSLPATWNGKERGRGESAGRDLTREDLFLWYKLMSLRHPENRICIDYL